MKLGSFGMWHHPRGYVSNFLMRLASSWGAPGRSGSLADREGESTLLSQSGEEKGFRWSGAGNLGVPLEWVWYVAELLGSHQGCQVPFRPNTHPSIHQLPILSIHLFISHPSAHPASHITLPSIILHPSSTHQLTHPSTHPLTRPSINPSIYHSFIQKHHP